MEQWHSPRYYQEQRDLQLAKIFDDLIDLALKGTITLEQAVKACKEVVANEAVVTV